jgi:hypothetical protein
MSFSRNIGGVTCTDLCDRRTMMSFSRNVGVTCTDLCDRQDSQDNNVFLKKCRRSYLYRLVTEGQTGQ